jgi:hypothetical protein
MMGDRLKMSLRKCAGILGLASTLVVSAAVSTIVATLAVSTARGETAVVESPKPTMHAVFEEMRMLIPLSLTEERWSEPASRAEVLASLARLETAAAALETHGRDREAGFGELAISLAGDLYEARERYRVGAYEEARFFLTGSLQNCVACHIRLRTDASFPLAEALMDQEEVDALPPREKARLLVIVRRFDEALTTWEGLLADPEISASQLDASGVLVDYLNVGIRVRGAIERATGTLDRFVARKDLPFYLKRRTSEWQDALAKLDPEKFKEGTPSSLELGVALAREAGETAEGPYGRDGLIQDLAAASQLVGWLEQDRAMTVARTRNRTETERNNAALAYYWLGVVEARSLDGFWVNLSERHLEAAIRSDPKGPIAGKAYALLEETQVLGYGGSSGVHLPTDVWNLLRELRELMGVEG